MKGVHFQADVAGDGDDANAREDPEIAPCVVFAVSGSKGDLGIGMRRTSSGRRGKQTRLRRGWRRRWMRP